jgi:hypothetical protein
MGIDFMSRIPPWLRRLGILGVVIFVLWIITSFLANAIFEQEIQDWWASKVKPVVISDVPIEISFTIKFWLLILTVVLFIVMIVSSAILVRRYLMKRNGRRILEDLGLTNPTQLPNIELSPTDVINAIVDTRNGKMAPEFLANEILIKAVNGKVVKPEAAAKTLEEFSYQLVYRSDQTYTYVRKPNGI